MSTDYDDLIKRIYLEHREHYDKQKKTFNQYKDIYCVDFYNGLGASEDDVQVPDASSWIDSFVNSLFSKAPAVSIGADIYTPTAKPAVAETLVNEFFFNKNSVFTDACRLSLIYTCSFLKLSSKDEKISLHALKPWEVIVDSSAPDWYKQRWTGCISEVPLAIAKEMFPGKRWNGHSDGAFLSEDNTQETVCVGDSFEFVTIVEFYDLIEEKVIVWSPSLVKENGVLTKDVLYIRYNGIPTSPIVPLYMWHEPGAPLKGISSLRKIYDQVREKNLIRTRMAGQVRKDTRQLLIKKGAIDTKAIEALVTGEDGAIIQVDTTDSLQSAFTIVPTIPVSGNYAAYLGLIEQDINKSSPTGPFVRGEATKATATEVNIMQDYTSNDIGRMARIRDEAIERCASYYLSLHALNMIDTTDVILVGGKTETYTSEDIDATFKISAIDQLATPALKQQKRKEFEGLIPLLAQLGIPQSYILEQMADLYEMPKLKELAKQLEQDKKEQPPAPPAGPPVPTE